MDTRSEVIRGNSYLFQGFGCLIAKVFAQNQIKFRIRSTGESMDSNRAEGLQSWLGSN